MEAAALSVESGAGSPDRSQADGDATAAGRKVFVALALGPSPPGAGEAGARSTQYQPLSKLPVELVGTI